MTLAPHLEAIKNEALRISVDAWARRSRWILTEGVERVGPCPCCGGKDRFSINTAKNVFNCRRCEISGEGVIKLVEAVQGVGFTKACEIITGRAAEAPVDPAKAKKLAAEAEAEKQKQLEQANRYRLDAIAAGNKIWRSTARVDWRMGHPVFDYLRRRGIDVRAILDRAPDALACLRFSASHEWGEYQGYRWAVLASTPAMIAGIQDRHDDFAGVHRTWIDLAQPKGRLVLPLDEAGKERDTKKVRGTQKGCAIRLYTPNAPRRIVAGEGIETTLTALAANFEPDTAYWCLINLHNMHGKAFRKPSGKIVQTEPDMDDADAFVPPEWCDELVYLRDGDDPKSKITEKLTRGLRRAMRLKPGRKGFIVPPSGAGQDLNDVAMAMASAKGVEA